MDTGTLVMAPLESERVLDAVRCMDGLGGRIAGRVPDYESEAVSAKIVRIVLSYIRLCKPHSRGTLLSSAQARPDVRSTGCGAKTSGQGRCSVT